MTVAQRVENILRVSQAARNSDRELIIIYMQKLGMELTPKQIEIFRHMPSVETIRRTRQALQEQGKYEADSTIKRERSHKSMVMQQTMPSAKPEQVEKTIERIVLPWGQG